MGTTGNPCASKSKKPILVAKWVKDMNQKQSKAEGERAPNLPTSIMYPGAGVVVQNYSILDLDLPPNKIKDNFISVIAHHRYWTWAKSDVAYKWDGNEYLQSWVSPPTGAYLYYMRYKSKLMCLVGDGAQSWFSGIITETVLGEFSYDKMEKVSKTQRSIKKYKALSSDPSKCFIQSIGGIKRFSLPGKGNYLDPLKVEFGPVHLMKAFKKICRLMEDNLTTYLKPAIDVLVIHLWDAARNDIIKDRVLLGFDEDYCGIHLEQEHVNMMKNWGDMSDEAISCIEEGALFKPKRGVPMDCAWDTLKAIRILHRPTAEPKGVFNMKDLPLSLKDGGRALDIERKYPEWIINSYPQVNQYMVEVKEQTSTSTHDATVSETQKKCNLQTSTYIVERILGDGRCLFRALAHGSAIRALNRYNANTKAHELAELREQQVVFADILRFNVAEEMEKRRDEMEGCIKEDFQEYVSKIKKPSYWGGERELYIASHVLRTPIAVYTRKGGNFTLYSSYGFEEYSTNQPIKVLYKDSSHYDLIVGMEDLDQSECVADGGQ